MEYSPIALALLNQATDTRLPINKQGMGATLSDMMLQQAQQQSTQADADAKRYALNEERRTQEMLKGMDLSDPAAVEKLYRIDPALGIKLMQQQRMQQQQKIMQDALTGGLDTGGGAEKLAAIGAMSGNPQLIQLAQFKQAQENRAQDEVNRIAAEERAKTRQISAEERARQDKIAAEQRANAEKGAQFYATKLEDSGLTELHQKLKEVENLLPPEGEDIAGFGYGMGIVPDAIVSQNGLSLRQAVAGVRNGILKARSGGAVTDSEKDRLLEELGEGLFKSDAQLRAGLKSVKNTLNAKLKNFAAGVTPEALSEYKARGGDVLPSKGVPSGVPEKLWNSMTPDEQAEFEAAGD